MIKLLKFEFRKLIRHKSIYICLAVQIAYLCIYALITKNSFLSEIISTTSVQFMQSALKNGMTTTLLAIAVSLLACEDRTDDVLKNIYSRGYSPTEVLAAEYIAILSYGIVFVGVTWITGAAAGAAVFTVDWESEKLGWMLIAQLFIIIGYISLFFFVAKSLTKVAGVIAINVVVPSILSTIVSFIDLAFNNSSFHPGDYVLSGSLSKMSGATSALDLISSSAGAVTSMDIFRAFMVAAVFIVAFMAGAVLINRRRSA